MKDILITIIGFTCLIVGLPSLYGFIAGCFRYWTREPYDEDISFKDFIVSGIVDVFLHYGRKLLMIAVILVICVILSILFL